MRNKWYVTLGLILLLAGILVACRKLPTIEPTATVAPPTATIVPPTDTVVPPTDTVVPPTDTVVPPTDTVAPTLSPEPTGPSIDALRERCQEKSVLGRRQQSNVPPGLRTSPYANLIYVDGEVVISGRDSKEIQGVLQNLGLSQLEGRQSFPLGSDRVIGVYTFAPSAEPNTVEQITCMINEYACENGKGVCADPNYHLSPAGWRGGGSPWTQNGEWAGDQEGGGQRPTPELDLQDFVSQWALSDEEGGIKLYSEQNRIIDVDSKEKIIRIGVFDTSPFEDRFAEIGATKQITVPWKELMGSADEDLADGHLVIQHFTLRDAPECPGDNRRFIGEDLKDPGPYTFYKTESLEGLDRSNHGLFVAGLAHAVAPHSEIYLVRVLQNDACGNLYSIGDGIQGFVDQAVQDKVDGIVINLSLGVHQPPNPTSLGLPDEVTNLQDIIKYAISKQAVVIAAAGNGSYTSTVPLEMEIPAHDSGVVGVVASNRDRERGCFSNADPIGSDERVAAPGGDGVHGILRFADDSSQPSDCVVPNCTDPALNDKCLIGPVYKPEPGFAYWVGTSFAAPLVSGAAALVLAKEGPLSSEVVTNTITSGTCAGAADDPTDNINITHLAKTLGLSSTCPP